MLYTAGAMHCSHASIAAKVSFTPGATANTVALVLLLGLALAGCRAKPGDRHEPSERPSARQATLTPHQRQLNLQSFDYVWNTIRQMHYDPTLAGLDWNAVRDELRPKVEQAQTMQQARRAMQEMVGRLEQSHFGIIPASVYHEVDVRADADGAGTAATAPATMPAANGDSPRKRGDGVIGADVRILDGRVIVTRVDPQLGAAAAGVKPGWEVVSVDRRKLQPMIRKLREHLPDNLMRPAMTTLGATALLTGPIGDSSKFTFRDGRGRRVEKTIRYARPSGTKASFGHMPTMYVDFDNRRLEPNVGYIAFKPFIDPPTVMEKLAAALKQHDNADGIILDLRGNPGGIGAMAMGVGNFFVTKPNQQLGTMVSRDGSLNFVLNPRPGAYTGPLAILVDEMSMSTSEILAGGLQDLGRAKVFGTRTPGAALPSIVERLPNGDGFQYVIANYISAGGESLEGRGVIPDFPVELDRSSLLKGRDPVIDAAVAWIDSQRNN